MIYLDLFSGVGGFAKGFNDAGLKITKHYFSEIDKHAIAVYKYNFKNAQYAGDVRTISKTTITERPNIISFGFPCQALSVAGKGEGLSGARSGLFFEAIRIVKEFRPEVFIFENVKGLLSSNNGKDFETVLRTIADIGLYECEWQLVNTAWVLPQNRERIYFVGHLRGHSHPGVFPFRKNDFEFIESQRKTQGNGQRLWMYNSRANTISSRYYKDGSENLIKVKPVLTPDRTEKRQNGRRFKEDGEPAFTLNTQDKHGIMIVDELYSNRRREYSDNSPTLKHNSSQLKVENNTQIRRLTEIECERLQGFNDNWTKYGNYDGVIKEVSKTQRYKQMGNAVTTDWPRMIAERLIKLNNYHL